MAEIVQTTGQPLHRRAIAIAGQFVLYALFALFIGTFSHWPPYRHLDPDQALIRLSLVHTGKPIGECRTLSADELAKLPPNMRTATRCPRERSPITVELDIDGRSAARIEVAPSGLSRDGSSAVYKRLTVPAGERRISVRLRDDVRQAGFSYQLDRRITLAPGQVVVIDFDSENSRITLQ